MLATSIFLILVALAALGWIWRAARGRQTALTLASDLSGRTCPVDIEAFRNLTSPTEEEFLRSRLRGREYRSVRRRRVWAALGYLNAASRNAAILMMVGEAASKSQDQSIATAGAQMVQAALQFRLYVVPVRLRLLAAAVLPGLPLSPSGIDERYQQATALAWQLGRLQNPLTATRVARSL